MGRFTDEVWQPIFDEEFCNSREINDWLSDFSFVKTDIVDYNHVRFYIGDFTLFIDCDIQISGALSGVKFKFDYDGVNHHYTNKEELKKGILELVEFKRGLRKQKLNRICK